MKLRRDFNFWVCFIVLGVSFGPFVLIGAIVSVVCRGLGAGFRQIADADDWLRAQTLWEGELKTEIESNDADPNRRVRIKPRIVWVDRGPSDPPVPGKDVLVCWSRGSDEEAELLIGRFTTSHGWWTPGGRSLTLGGRVLGWMKLTELEKIT